MSRMTLVAMTLLIGFGSVSAQTVKFDPKVAERDPLLVSDVQRRLTDLGYYKGRIDGIYLNLSRWAVASFQRDTYLPVTGRLDNETVKALVTQYVLEWVTQSFGPFHPKSKLFGTHDGMTKKGHKYVFANKIDGPLPDIVQSACNMAKITCVIKLWDSWKYAQARVRDLKRAEGMFLIGWSAATKRAEFLRRTTSVASAQYAFFVRTDDKMVYEPTHLSVLDGYTVYVYCPSNICKSLRKLWHEARRQGVQFTIRETESDDPNFKRLSESTGQVAVYSNKDVGHTFIRGQNLQNLRVAGVHEDLFVEP